MGVIGSLIFSGCAEGNRINRCTHFGGCIGSPVYVVYLTENEALGIIRSGLEAAGLEFNTEPPDYVATLFRQEVTLNLYDKDKGVAISCSDLYFHDIYKDEVISQFLQQNKDMKFGLFFNDRHWSGICSMCITDKVTEQVNEEGKLILEDNLNTQIEQFIELLRKEEII
jgi:hypothetical protein